MPAMSRLGALAACPVIMAVSGHGPVQAAPVFFATSSGILGTSQAHGATTVYGFTALTSGAHAGRPAAADLSDKNGGGGETGVGPASTGDQDINTPARSEAVVLDVSAVSGQDLRTGLGSVQGGEGRRAGFSPGAALPPTKQGSQATPPAVPTSRPPLISAFTAAVTSSLKRPLVNVLLT